MTKENKFKNFAVTFEQGVEEMAKEIISLGVANKVRLMPDTHIGKGASIGFTAPVTDKVIPNIIGVDIGCGMTIWNLGKELKLSLKEINDIIKTNIPNGFDAENHTDKHSAESVEGELISFQKEFMNKLSDDLLNSFKRYDGGLWFLRQLGTLGSGNHFIEIDKDDEGNNFLVIHSGSRGLGNAVHAFWQKKAIQNLKDNYVKLPEVRKRVLKTIPANVPAEKMGIILANKLKGQKPSFKEQEQAYLEGDDITKYLNDMKVAQRYAIKNRRKMASIILSKMFGMEVDIENQFEWFDSTHNFIAEDNIMRKGATSAYKDELAIIPLNMRDGSLIVKGKGNEDWNYSAPHGAGRLLSRKKAMTEISLEDFKSVMEGVYSTTINENTIDEAPQAYKNAKEIMEAIEPTAEIIKIIKPILNFKGV